jgi:hypothetical protein
MAGITFRDVEIRTWPERGDLLVIDVAGAAVLAQYLLPEADDPTSGSGVLFDPKAPYRQRAEAAVKAVERDQDFLRLHFQADDDSVCLRPVETCRKRLTKLLGDFGLKVSDTDLEKLLETEEVLWGMELGRLYRLLCDWHDLIDRRYPSGSSQLDPGSWVHRARPEDCYHFHYLESGQKDQGSDDQEAFELFRQLIDVPLSDFSFGMLIRYVYFLRAEFPGFDPFGLRALREAGLKQETARRS